MGFDAVLFDVGGVLTVPLTEVFVERAVASQVDLARVGPILLAAFASAGDGDHPAHRLERGEITLEAFFALLGPDADAARVLLDPASPWFGPAGLRPHPGMHAFAAEVKAAGLATGIVSNTVREWQPAWDEASPGPGVIDVAVWSWEAGVRKPDPAIYRLALDRLGVAASRTVFLDDFPAMTEAARALGITTVDVGEHAAAIAEARGLLGLSAGAG